MFVKKMKISQNSWCNELHHYFSILMSSKVPQMKVQCGGPILPNTKFTHEYTNFAILLLTLSQFQALTLQSYLKVHSFFQTIQSP
jgi:hypothetical protein